MSNPKPTGSQQGTFNTGTTQGYNQYKGVKKGGQSGTVKTKGK